MWARWRKGRWHPAPSGLRATAHNPPAKSSRCRRATGTGPFSPTSNVVTARWAAGIAVAVEWRHGIELRGRERIVERHRTVGKVAAEATDIADQRHFRRDLQATTDDLRNRQRGGMRSAPWRRPDASAVTASARRATAMATAQRSPSRAHKHAKKSQNILDNVGRLDADDRVGQQAHAAQPPGDHRRESCGRPRHRTAAAARRR